MGFCRFGLQFLAFTVVRYSLNYRETVGRKLEPKLDVNYVPAHNFVQQQRASTNAISGKCNSSVRSATFASLTWPKTVYYHFLPFTKSSSSRARFSG